MVIFIGSVVTIKTLDIALSLKKRPSIGACWQSRYLIHVTRHSKRIFPNF